MSNFRSVSKTEPCPICGKTDWCSIQGNGTEERIYCRRILLGVNIDSPTNGKSYVYIKQTNDGSCMYKNQEFYEAAREEWLAKKYGSKKNSAPRKQFKPSPTAPAPPQITIDCNASSVLSNQELDKIYRAFLNKLTLAKKHKEYFLNERWSKQLIQSSLVRSTPPMHSKCYDQSRHAITRELIQEFGSVEGVPGFYMDQDEKWTFTGSGILIPQYDHNGKLYRLRIRLDHPEKDEKGKEKGKYRNFSSFYEKKLDDGSCINAFNRGCRSGSHIGFYTASKNVEYTICYITEGEKKSIYASEELHAPVISVPGVNSFSKLLDPADDGYNVLEFLKAKGCRLLIIAYDADKYVNEHVLKYEQQLIAFLSRYGFQMAVASWNPGFGKGLDDILSIGVRPNMDMVSVI